MFINMLKYGNFTRKTSVFENLWIAIKKAWDTHTHTHIEHIRMKKTKLFLWEWKRNTIRKSAPSIFSFVLELIFQKVDWENIILILNGRYISNLRDIVLITENSNTFYKLIQKVQWT